jgi:hypothetical protein
MCALRRQNEEQREGKKSRKKRTFLDFFLQCKNSGDLGVFTMPKTPTTFGTLGKMVSTAGG